MFCVMVCVFYVVCCVVQCVALLESGIRLRAGQRAEPQLPGAARAVHREDQGEGEGEGRKAGKGRALLLLSFFYYLCHERLLLACGFCIVFP